MRDKVFIGVIATLLFGVPVYIIGLDYFSDNVTTIISLLLLCLLLFTWLIILITKFREPLFKRVFGQATRKIEMILEDLRLAISEYSRGNLESGTSKLIEALQSILARLAWIRLRQWMFAVATGMFVGFAALLGSYLLLKQNAILTDQNAKLNEQIKLANRQFNYAFVQQAKKETIEDQLLLSQPKMFNGTRDINNQYILQRLILNKEITDSLTPEGVYFNEKLLLRRLDLRYSDFLNFNTQNVVFQSVNWNNSSLNGCRFEGCIFNDVSFSKEQKSISQRAFGSIESDYLRFQYSELLNCDFTDCTFDKVDFRGATLNAANFVDSRFINVKMDSTTVFITDIINPELRKIAIENNAIIDKLGLIKRIQDLEKRLNHLNYSEYLNLKELLADYDV